MKKNALSTMKMQMEDFYSAEIDADVLIYNGTIEGELTSIDELVKKNSLFADFQAVKADRYIQREAIFTSSLPEPVILSRI